jgi:hypothetical protein
MLTILPVENKKQLSEFVKVPWHIYQSDKNWVPPLVLERKQAFSPNQEIFKHLVWKGWVAYEDQVPVGRISAQIDQAHLSQYNDHTGFFGNFESIDNIEIAAGLFGAAEKWLQEQGMTSIRGPFSLNINQEVGLLIEGFDTPPYFMMAHAPEYYSILIGQLDYKKSMDMFAFLISPAFEPPKFMTKLLAKLDGKLKLRAIDRKNSNRDLEIIRDIFNDAWSGNWGFVPFSKDEFLAIGKEMLMLVPTNFIQIAEIDREPVAFIVLLPNVNEAIADLNGRLWPTGLFKLIWRLKFEYPTTARIPLMGVRRRFHNTRLGPGLALAVVNALRAPAINKGIKSVEMSWVLENNEGMKTIVDILGGYQSKRYRVYDKKLDGNKERPTE